MAKLISFRQKVSSILFWSIISAAFIGPGTVTTASKAGASFGLSLLWALVFSIFATIILQEAAARLTIASGKNLGEIIALRYQQSKTNRIKILVFLAVAFGCAAYQAGNMLGAISGIELLADFPRWQMILPLGIICSLLLWIGDFKIIANLLGLIVAVMGMAFIYVAFQTDYSLVDIIGASVVPHFSEGASLLIIGLIGTTIVPYNLFLASGISKGQSIAEMRIGIVIAVIIGGLISMAILIVGTQVSGEFSFTALSNTLSRQLGDWAKVLFGIGLFVAGMSSSITSPLAAAVTAKSLFGTNNHSWSVRSTNFRLVWLTIMIIGIGFGISDIKPIPAIILAQAINGVLLPVVAIFLLLAVNDKNLLGAEHVNSKIANLLMLLIVGLSSFLGITNVLKALAKALPLIQINTDLSFQISSVISLLILVWLGRKVF